MQRGFLVHSCGLYRAPTMFHVRTKYLRLADPFYQKQTPERGRAPRGLRSRGPGTPREDCLKQFQPQAQQSLS